MIINTLLAGSFAALAFGAGLALGLRRRGRAVATPAAVPQPQNTAPAREADPRQSPDPRFQAGWVGRDQDRRVVLVNRLEDERRMLADRRLATAP